MTAQLPVIASIIGLGSVFLAAAGLVYLSVMAAKDKKAEDNRILAANQQATQLLQAAQLQAEEIIKKAMAEAQRILSDVQLLKQNSTHNFDTTLTQVAENLIQRFRHDADEFNKEYTEAFRRLRQEYAQKADQTFTSVEQLTREEFDKKMNEEFEKVKQQILVYRDNQFKAVDEEINKIIVQVVREVLGRSITLADHEKLVQEALEEAKQEGVFAG